MMKSLHLDCVIECERCRANLASHVRQDGTLLWIKPCDNCLKTSSNTGFDVGYDKGWEEAKQEVVN